MIDLLNDIFEYIGNVFVENPSNTIESNQINKNMTMDSPEMINVSFMM